jgi:hypothetical protein
MKITILALLLFLAGCGGNRTPVPANTIPENPFFNASMVGQAWTFVNGYGDHTVIQIQAAPVGSEAQVVWHYMRKENCRSYWNPGDCNAELWFGITENADHSWSATQFLASCALCLGNSGQGSATIKVPTPGGYLVIPPPQQAFRTGNTGYIPCWQLGMLSWVPSDCDISGASPVPWVTNSYMDNIQPLFILAQFLSLNSLKIAPQIALMKSGTLLQISAWSESNSLRLAVPPITPIPICTWTEPRNHSGMSGGAKNFAHLPARDPFLVCPSAVSAMSDNRYYVN